MKKGDELREKFNARVAVLVEKDGVFYGYLSHEDWSTRLPPIEQGNLSTPNDFITVAQQQRRSLSQTPEPVSSSSTPKPSEPKSPGLKPQTQPLSSDKSPESRQLLRDYFTGPSFIEDGDSELFAL